MLRALGRLILAAIFLALTGLIMAFAKFMPDLFFSLYPSFSRWILGVLSTVSNAFPFPLIEVLAVLLVLVFLWLLIRCFVQKHGLIAWFCSLITVVCGLIFLFTLFWGANHFAPSVGETLGLDVREYTREELEEATRYFAEQAALSGAKLEKAEDGTTVFSDFSTLSEEAGAGYEALSQEYELFSGSTAKVKKATGWYLMSKAGLTGIFIAFTSECIVNPDTAAPSLPYVMCHEISHRMGVAGEDEANYCAFLACEASGNEEFEYSGWYSAFIYCYNALYKDSKSAAKEIWEDLDEGVKADCRSASSHYDQYEGKVKEVSTAVNNVYLKTYAEESGVQSYGEVADQLIAWYLQNVGQLSEESAS